MERPATQYTRSGDVMIAYQVSGAGNPVDLVVTPGIVSHLDLDLDDPVERPWIDLASSYCRVIRFDKRGTGLSDRGVTGATLEERTDDIRAVMDAAGSERAVIFGVSDGGCMACLFAAVYPERTRGLLLWGTMPRWVQTDGYPWGPTLETHRRFIAEIGEAGPSREYLLGPGAGMSDMSDDELAEVRRYFAAAASPTQLAALEQLCQDMDVRDILPSIAVPTLALNRSGDPVAPIGAVRYLVEQIPGARLIEFPGQTHGFEIVAEDRAITDAIEEFVTGVRPAPHIDRVLTTVLFTDIVDSTAKAAALGDREWRGLVAQHHAIVRDELARHSGQEVDTAGDGFFATFDGPARATRCGLAVVDRVRRLGIEVRAGVHTGEVEVSGDKVAGIAVHVGARVCALATGSEVLASSTVKDLTAGSGLVFADAGEHLLKGLPDAWRLYRASL